MVPTDDEHTSANEPEENTSKQHNFLEKLKFWKRCKQEDDEPARLTPMPACLMHWWTPLAIAILLFVSSMLITSIWGTATYDEIIDSLLRYPHRWPFRMHTPSHEAIKLCLTVTGAGLAFSAWQQRSHENIRHEREKFIDAQREEFWHRRNTADSLLDKDSIYEQHEGVLRYFELADQLNKNKQLTSSKINPIQASILSILCAHIRHLGASPSPTRTDEIARAELQNVILQGIFERINTNLRGYWDGLTVHCTYTTFLTPISISNFTSSSEIRFDHSTFNHNVNLEIFQKATLRWKYATFHSQLTVIGQPKDSKNEKPVLHQDNFPTKFVSSQFENISICVFGDVTHQITAKGTSTNTSDLYFKACNFLRGKSTQHQSQEATKDADTTFFDEGKVTEPPDNYIWATISFNFISIQNDCKTKLYFTDCILGRIDPIEEWIIPSTNFTRCIITQSDEAGCTKDAPQNLNFFECKYAPAREPQALHDDREENW